MRADLHMHSLYSDGANPPAALARLARERGLALFSLTDHDTMEGSGEAAEAAKREGLRFVRGWEVSAYLGACKVHILGYGCEMGEAYYAFLEERKRGARVRAEEMRQKANAYFGLNVTMDEIEGYHVRKQSPIHTMATVTAFAERLHVDRGQLYAEVFARGGAAFSDAFRPTPKAAIDVIHALHGVAVLAHPGRILALDGEDMRLFRTLPREERGPLLEKNVAARRLLMEDLAAEGLDGIECHYTTHTAIETEYFSAFARAHGLLITGGSDYHVEDGRRILGQPAFDAADVEGLLLSLDGSI